MDLCVLSWNLFHGRSIPGAGRDLVEEFASGLAGWEWDVALLQEVPPWWSSGLAECTDATAVCALTSRNGLPAMRRWVGQRWPDVIKSNGGGSNVILVRGAAGPSRSRRLRWVPERRVLQAIELGDGTWAANLHASTDRRRARADLRRAATTAIAWAGEAPLILGGDLNLFDPRVPGLTLAASHAVDHVLLSGLTPVGAGETLEHASLSDHDPLRVTVTRTSDMAGASPSG